MEINKPHYYHALLYARLQGHSALQVLKRYTYRRAGSFSGTCSIWKWSSSSFSWQIHMLTIATFRDFWFQTTSSSMLILILTASNLVLQTNSHKDYGTVSAGMWPYHNDSGCIISFIMKAPVNSSDVTCLLQMAAVISCGWTCNEDRGHSLSRVCYMSRCNMTYLNQSH